MAFPVLLLCAVAGAAAFAMSKAPTTGPKPIAQDAAYWTEVRGGALYVKAERVRDVIEGLRGKVVVFHRNLAEGALIVNVSDAAAAGATPSTDAIAWVGAQVAAGFTVEVSLSNSFLISCRASQAKGFASARGSGIEISPYNAILQQA